MPYTPQNGDNVILEFKNPYTPQNGDNVILEFGDENINELLHTWFFMVIT
jgi:exosome complex RNA-binding protein Rrp4